MLEGAFNPGTIDDNKADQEVSSELKEAVNHPPDSLTYSQKPIDKTQQELNLKNFVKIIIIY